MFYLNIIKNKKYYNKLLSFFDLIIKHFYQIFFYRNIFLLIHKFHNLININHQVKLKFFYLAISLIFFLFLKFQQQQQRAQVQHPYPLLK